jgi:hypothetical protein
VITLPFHIARTRFCDKFPVARKIICTHNPHQLVPKLEFFDLFSRYEYTLSHLSNMVDSASATPYLSLPVVNKTISWESEWQLPTDIVASKNRIPDVVQKHIFVTGCTGFLGPVLAAEILKQYLI